MNLIALDFETFFSDDYTLKKMTTEAYIRDPRFDAHMVGIKFPKTKKTIWVPKPSIRNALNSIDWTNTAVVAHHAQFDGAIMSVHYGIKPAMWFDTMSMARMVHGNHISASLESLAQHYGLSAKTVPYDDFRGKLWEQIDEGTRQMLGSGCCHDVDLTFTLFEKLLKGFPQEELLVIDTTVRMFTEPCLVGDVAHFEALRDSEFLRKNEMLYELGVGESDLASTEKFAALLESMGVDVAMKWSKPTKTYPRGREVPALAATDQFMRDLADSQDETLALLAQARMEVKSTINETRAGRLSEMSKRGPLMVYLSYCGAHTTRWSGGDKVNFQNLGRKDPRLRYGVKAPPGYKFVSVDQAQGECRVVNWLAGQWDVVERFKHGHDPYIPIASKFYGREITKADQAERGTGKQLELSCGFGAGTDTIIATAKRGGYGPPVYLTQEEGKRARDLYRSTHAEVVKLWREGDDNLVRLANKQSFDWGPMHGEGGRLFLPNGAWIDYTTLEWHSNHETGKAYWRLKTRKGWMKYWGGVIVENAVQALSRVITSQAMLKIRHAGYRIVGMAHDDLWMLVPEDDTDYAGRFFKETMATTPTWAPGLPLGADVKIGDTYQ